MKILYLRTVFWFGLKSGGSVGHTSGVINELSKNVQLDVISNDNLPGLNSKINIVSPGFLKFIPFRLGEVLYSFKLIKKLNKEVKNYNYIYQRYSGLSFAGAYLSKKKCHLILEYNGSDVWGLKNWSIMQSSVIKSNLIKIVNVIRIPIVKHIENYNLKSALLIIVVSAPIKEALIKKGIPSEKILVNPNGVDPEIYSPSISGNEIRAKYGLEKHKVIGFIGTFESWHGVLEIAKSIELFYYSSPKHIEEVKFLFVGDGKLMPIVKKITKKNRKNDKVILAGLVPQSEGPKYLAACDILLSPHIKNPDGSKFFGSPTKLFEYMAMGKAIIASNLNQIGEVLEHNKTAYLIEPGDVNQLVNAMIILLSSKKIRDKLGSNARSEILINYSWRKHVNRIFVKLGEIKL